jgi:4-amino-4-deoxy-L-arabinose transferase-like glycosyltransferase
MTTEEFELRGTWAGARVGGSSRLGGLALALALALLAFIPRALDLGAFLTIDEANFWLRRSELFAQALRDGDFAATALSAHPGVTTMWLGSAGLALWRACVEWGLAADISLPARLAVVRLPLALAHSGAILAGYLLLRRLLPWPVALLGALLWALDPFVIGYSRLLHTDALAGSFATVSVLALLRGLGPCLPAASPTSALAGSGRAGRGMLVLSGVFGGLAVLSKVPALALGPLALLAVLPFVRERGFGWAARALLVWGLALALTVFALWPALWVDPLAALRALREGALVEGGQPHMLGNFFLGRAVDAPGPLFYPVALALRLTPWALLGLLGLPLVWRRMPRDARRSLALLAAFVLIFVLAMTLFPKKFNRYIVPAFPALDILAAAGLVGAAAWLLGKWKRQGRARRWAGPALLVLLTLPVLALAHAHPYYLTYFNPLLGGGPAGARTFVVGWGEGYDQAAAWLNQRRDITGVVTVSAMTPTLQPFLRQGAQAVPPSDPLPERAGYVVISVEQTQRGLVLPPFDRFYGRATPLHTISIGGAEYLWIYQVPPQVPEPLEAGFGAAIGLLGSERGELRAGEPLRLRLFWAAREPPAADYLLFVHLLGPGGERVAQADLPPGGAEQPTSSWVVGSYVTTALELPLPRELAPGDYRLLIGLYDPATGARLPLAPELAADAALAGPHALLLGTLRP